MTLSELYSRYGELMVKLELLNGAITGVKQAIQEELNKQQAAPKAEETKEVEIE